MSRAIRCAQPLSPSDALAQEAVASKVEKAQL
jgi:hypothetical protein